MNVIEIAREAGIEWQRNTTITGKVRITTCGSQPVDKLERFAALVRAAALEEAAQKCDDLWQDDGTAYDCREAIRAMKGKQT